MYKFCIFKAMYVLFFHFQLKECQNFTRQPAPQHIICVCGAGESEGAHRKLIMKAEIEDHLIT